jgi:hypothetical protein
MTDPNPASHLLIDPLETDVTASALRLLVADATIEAAGAPDQGSDS